MKLCFVLHFLCNCALLAYCARSSSSSSAYTKPICLDVDGFYCPISSTCLPRTERCIGENSEPDCLRKTYDHCGYDQANGKFEVYRHSTPLEVFGSSSRNTKGGMFDCIGRELAHQFITYRGLMYEFGDYSADVENGARIQDPNDPNYEYNTRKITKTVYVGLSSCTYEQILVYTRTWSNYNLCSHNCQDFAKGLGTYLIRECVKSETSLRSHDADDEIDDFEFAQYIFSIAGDGTCNDTLVDNSATQPISALIVAVTAAIIGISFSK